MTAKSDTTPKSTRRYVIHIEVDVEQGEETDALTRDSISKSLVVVGVNGQTLRRIEGTCEGDGVSGGVTALRAVIDNVLEPIEDAVTDFLETNADVVERSLWPGPDKAVVVRRSGPPDPKVMQEAVDRARKLMNRMKLEP